MGLKNVRSIGKDLVACQFIVETECGHEHAVGEYDIRDGTLPWPPAGCTVDREGYPVELGRWGCSDCEELPRAALVAPQHRHRPGSYTWLTCPHCGTPFDSREAELEHAADSPIRVDVEICPACALGLPLPFTQVCREEDFYETHGVVERFTRKVLR